MGGFARGPFAIEGRGLIFIESDPGGEACHLLSGFFQGMLEQTLGGTARVHHSLCQSRSEELCRWEGEMTEPFAGLPDAEDTASPAEAAALH